MLVVLVPTCVGLGYALGGTTVAIGALATALVAFSIGAIVFALVYLRP
jgi:hypothetical protein